MSSAQRLPRLLERPPRDELEAEARGMITGAEEPLPEELRARVWAGFARRLDGPSAAEGRRHRWLVAAAAVAAAATVVLAFSWARRPAHPPEGRVIEVRGVAGVAEGSDGWRRLDGDSAFAIPAKLRVRDGASAEVRLARGVDIRVSGPASLSLASQGVDLESGRAVHSVQKGHGRWVVQLGPYRVVVKGTQFWTARRGEEAAVCLLEGQVQVRLGPELLATLSPGDAWRSSPRAPAFPSDLACRVAGSEGTGRLAAAPARTGVREDERPTPADEESADAIAEAPARLAERPTARASGTEDAAAIVTRGTPGDPGASRVDPATSRSSESDEAIAAAPAPPAEVPPPARSTTELPLPEAPPSPPPPPEPERAPCADAPDPEACFRAIADGADLRAQAALYRLGEIRRARGNAEGALDAWLEYRRRFPSGALAQEADLAILEVRLRLGQSSNALRAAGRFLEHWPASEHSAEVTAIRGVLRQRAGDCASALSDFDRALAARVSAGRREEALFGRATCLDAAGRTADAANAYRAYLRERPDGRFATRAREALEAIEGR